MLIRGASGPARTRNHLFLLKDGSLPVQGNVEPWHRPRDAISAGFATRGGGSHGVLTLYWPMPWHHGRFELIDRSPWKRLAERLLPELRYLLEVLGLKEESIRQVRMYRWGHALPLAMPSFIAEGHPQAIRQQIDDVVYFVQQDNWALPTVENSLLDAFEFAPQIAAGL